MNPWDDQDRFVMTAPKPGIFRAFKGLAAWLGKLACLTAVMWFFVWLAVIGEAQFNHWLDGVLGAIK